MCPRRRYRDRDMDKCYVQQRRLEVESVVKVKVKSLIESVNPEPNLSLGLTNTPSNSSTVLSHLRDVFISETLRVVWSIAGPFRLQWASFTRSPVGRQYERTGSSK